MHTLKNLSLALTLAIAGACAAHAAAPSGSAADYGSAIAGATTGRVIEVTPRTRHINVTQGEVVTLRMGGESLTWQVRTFPNVSVFPLSKIAPQGALSQPVSVYVAADPVYQNG